MNHSFNVKIAERAFTFLCKRQQQKQKQPTVTKLITTTAARGSTIAQWIRLRLPFCHPGFESQAHHLHFYHL